jgi:hypothetical protein
MIFTEHHFDDILKFQLERLTVKLMGIKVEF